MIKVELFEPPMCCSTGICGPSVDESLVRISEAIQALKNKYAGIEIERYQISQQPAKFRENPEVYGLVKTESRKSLPITAVNGKVLKAYRYPTLEELEARIGEIINGN